jgi:CTP synthase (UTP-ammonia lyase)
MSFQATAGFDVSECLFRSAVAMDGEIASSPFFASARKFSRKDESKKVSIFLHLKLLRVVVAYREFHL